MQNGPAFWRLHPFQENSSQSSWCSSIFTFKCLCLTPRPHFNNTFLFVSTSDKKVSRRNRYIWIVRFYLPGSFIFFKEGRSGPYHGKGRFLLEGSLSKYIYTHMHLEREIPFGGWNPIEKHGKRSQAPEQHWKEPPRWERVAEGWFWRGRSGPEERDWIGQWLCYHCRWVQFLFPPTIPPCLVVLL